MVGPSPSRPGGRNPRNADYSSKFRRADQGPWTRTPHLSVVRSDCSRTRPNPPDPERASHRCSRASSRSLYVEHPASLASLWFDVTEHGRCSAPDRTPVVSISASMPLMQPSEPRNLIQHCCQISVEDQQDCPDRSRRLRCDRVRVSFSGAIARGARLLMASHNRA